MPVNTNCEHCGQQLQVMEEHLGRPVRCPKCYQVFTAKAGAGGAAAAPGPAPEAAAAAPSMQPAKFCPHCGSALQAGAPFCPGCGKSPGEPPQAPAGMQAPSFPTYPQSVPAPYQAGPSTCGMATASLVLGIIGIVACFGPLAGIPAVICGHMAKGQIRNSGGTLQGDGMATWGLVLGYFSILMTCLFFGVGIMGNSGHHP